MAWDGGGDGNNWTDPLNWSSNALPGSNDDVTISVVGNPTIQLANGTQQIRSLTSDELINIGGGVLDVQADIKLSANLSLAGGILRNATLSSIGGAQPIFTATGGTLDGVTLNGEMLVQNTVNVVNGLVVNGTIKLGTGGGYSILRFAGTQSLSGTGQVLFGNGGFNGLIADTNGMTLTIGAGMTLRGGSGYSVIGYSDTYFGSSPNFSLVNQGTIIADNPGSTLRVGVAGGSLTNQGILQAAGGGSLNVAGLTGATGTISLLGASSLGLNGTNYVLNNGLALSSGQTATLNGAWSSTSTITATSATLTLNGTWSNSGTITSTGGTVNLGGTFTTAGLGTFNRTGGTVNLTGTLDNTGATLGLTAATGSWNIAGGGIKNGTVSTADGAQLIGSITVNGYATTGTLDGVTLNGEMLVQNTVNVVNGLVVNGTIKLGTGGGYSILRFAGTQSLSGTGQVLFGNGGFNGLIADTNGMTLTIGAGMTLRGGSGYSVIGYSDTYFGSSPNFSLVNQGTIIADNPGSTLRVGVAGGSLTNQGILQAAGGGSLNVAGLTGATGTISLLGASSLGLNGTNYVLNNGLALSSGQTATLNGSWSNSGTLRVTEATLNLGGTFITAAIGTILRTGGTVNLTGMLNNTGNTLVLNAVTGSWNLAGGSIKNGNIATADGAQLIGSIAVNGNSTEGTLDGVTLNGDLQVQNTIKIQNGLVLNGTAKLGVGSGYSILRFIGTQSLSGTGQVLFGSAGTNGLVADTNGMTLTIGAGLTLRGGSGYSVIGYSDFYFGSAQSFSLINLGSIIADTTGATLRVSSAGGSFINQGILRSTVGSSQSLGAYGPFLNLGSIEAQTGSTLNLAGPWDNASTITLTGATLNLGGNFTPAAMGIINRTGGTINLTGTLLNVDGISASANGFYGASVPLLAFDGQASTTWNPGSTSGTITARFSSPLTFDSVVLSVQAQPPSNNVYTLYGSDDGTNFTQLSQSSQFIQGVGIVLSPITFPAITSRYLRISATASASWIAIDEVRLALDGDPVEYRTPSTLHLNNSTGSWNLSGGTIIGGSVDFADGQSLVPTTGGGMLNGVTINGDLNLSTDNSFLRVVNGLTLNGTAHLSGSNVHIRSIGNQTFAGAGTIAFEGTTGITRHLTIEGNSSLTLAPGFAVRGGRGQVGSQAEGSGVNNLINLGTIIADVMGQTLTVVPTGTATSAGSLQATSGGILNTSGQISAIHPNFFRSDSGSTIAVNGELLTDVDNAALFQPKGTTTFSGGTAVTPRRLEIMSRDLGNVATAYTNNFAYGTLLLQNGSYVRLIDLSDNAPGVGDEAIYVDSLIVRSGATFDLNGRKLYARASQIDGQIIGGSVQQTADSGALLVGTATPGQIATPGELDEWTFFALAGRTLSIQVNPGSLSSPAAPSPVAPALNFAQITLVDSTGASLGTVNATVAGQILTLNEITIPTSGIYKLQIRAASGQSAATGNYYVAAFDVTADTAPLLLNQQTVGVIQSPFNTDRWTFSLSAGQQIRFDLINASVSSLRFSLAGPDGYQPFTGIEGDSDLINIPAGRGGNYRLTVSAPQGQIGSYRFAVNTTTLIDLPLATPTAGTLAGTGSAVLFKVSAPGGTPLLIDYTHYASSDRTEVYLSRSTPPTRGEYDYRGDSPNSASQSILVPNAAAGDWYVLVYLSNSNNVSSPASYSIRAVADKVYVRDATLNNYATGSLDTLIVMGAGFIPGAQVRLVAWDSQSYPAVSTEVDSNSRITAVIDRNSIHQTIYRIQVTLPTGETDTLTLPYGWNFTQPSGTPRLETRIITSGALGRHGIATIYVEYANTGNEAMPAPIIQLRSADPDGSDRPILTLDQSLLAQGYWTSVMPAGFANSVSFLASGKIQPGLLMPGERIQVPVYYAGLLQPWDFTDGQVELGLSVIKSTESFGMNWAGKTYVQIDYVSTSGPTSVVRELDWIDGAPIVANDRELLRLVGWSSSASKVTRYEEPGMLQLRPESIAPDAWNAILANLQQSVGSTLGNWVGVLSENAQFLARSGVTVTDISQLWAFEIAQASASLGPMQVIDAATDLALRAPGIDLTFSRSFANGITSRYTSGAFGQGWQMGWDLTLVEEPSPAPGLRGAVTLTSSSGLRQRYEPDSRDPLNSKYFSGLGDTSQLRKSSNGKFELRAIDGTITLFSAAGQFEYVEDRNGNRVTLGYDSNGRLGSLTHSSGAWIHLAYNAAGHVSWAQDSAGRTITYDYDATNTYLLSATTDAGKITTYTYDTTGGPQTRHALTTVTRSGVMQTILYDAFGRIDDIYLANHQQNLDFAYDTAGMVSLNDGTGTTKLYYDHRGLLSRVIDAFGNPSLQEFDASYRLTRITAPTGETQVFSWDSRGNLTSLVNELGYTTSFAYDSTYSLLTSFTDARANTTKYGYDSEGNLVTTTYPDQSVERLGDYSLAGLPGQSTNRRGQIMRFEYNSAGQPTKQLMSDGTEITYHYDVRGNLIQIVDGEDVTTYEYDFAESGDRLTKVTDANGRYLIYEYDDFGRRASMTDQLGYETRYEYDAAGRLWRLRDGDGELIVTYIYDPSGRLSRVDKGNGTFTTYTYDPAGQLLSLVNHRDETSINSHFAYTYDSRGRRTSMSTLDGDWTYAYDATGQLTQAVFVSNDPAVIPDQDLNYVYDAVGNRIRTVLNGVTTEYVANKLNQYSSVGGVAYAYDADGNLTFDGENTYDYDERNKLVRVSGPSGIAEYEYDAVGNRIASLRDGVRTEFVVDPGSVFGQPMEIESQNGSVSRVIRNVYGIGLAARLDLNGLQFYDFDATGSTVATTRLDGHELQRYSFDPFGNALLSATANFENATPFQFMGQFGARTESPNATSTWARTYSPVLGAFVSDDPVGLAGQDVNLRRYSNNDPVNSSDPFGFTAYTYSQLGSISGNGWSAPAYSGGGIGLNNPAEQNRPYSKGSGNYGPIPAGDYTLGEPYYSKKTGALTFPLIPSPDTVKNFPMGRQPQTFKIHGDNSKLNNSASEGCIILDEVYRKRLKKGDTIHVPGLPPSFIDNIHTVNAVDPNDKLAPVGVGELNYVRADAEVPYRIRFENVGPGSEDPASGESFSEDKWATAPAQRVTITDQLSGDLDWSTFRLSELGFGDTIIAIPPESQHLETTVSITYDGVTFDVLLVAGIDLLTGRVYATFQTLDAVTGLPPGVLTGFLLPEDGTGRGKGYFSFTVRPKDDLPTGTELTNVALISFDGQTLIATNQADPFDPTSAVTDPANENYGRLNARNTIDNDAPTSQFDDLPEYTEEPVVLHWSGSDGVGSGIDKYEIFVSTNGGEYLPLSIATDVNELLFAGTAGNEYRFSVVATDRVGLRQLVPSETPVITIVAGAAPRVTKVTLVSSGNLGGEYDVPVGSGSQLATVPLGLVDAIRVSFSEPVDVTLEHLQVLGVRNATYEMADFEFDAATITATWRLAHPLGADAISLRLNADGESPIRDLIGNALDGEWTNPIDIAAVGSSDFPSGDGTAGGDFAFDLSVLPGDANRDGTVDGADYVTWADHYLTVGDWEAGDFNNDALVNGDDYSIWADNFLARNSTWLMGAIQRISLAASPFTPSILGAATESPPNVDKDSDQAIVASLPSSVDLFGLSTGTRDDKCWEDEGNALKCDVVASPQNLSRSTASVVAALSQLSPSIAQNVPAAHSAVANSKRLDVLDSVFSGKLRTGYHRHTSATSAASKDQLFGGSHTGADLLKKRNNPQVFDPILEIDISLTNIDPVEGLIESLAENALRLGGRAKPD